jgi:hypothetical protein
MTNTTATATTTVNRATRVSAGTRQARHTTRTLLAGGALAGPLFILVSLVQALTRSGYTLTHQEVSLLSLGSWGWIQVSNFVIAGALFLAGGVGLRRALQGGPGREWAPRLMGAIGIGMVGGGIFRVDPSAGYPAGTVSGASATSDWHGMLHTLFGSVAFLALVALCFVLARRFAASGERRWAMWSRIAGVLAAVGIASGGAPHGSLTLFIGIGAAMCWVAAASARVRSAPGQHDDNASWR